MERTRPAGDAEVERTDRSGPVCAASVADGCGPEDGLILQTGGELMALKWRFSRLLYSWRRENELTQEEAAERVGKSRSNVANVLRLLNLSAPVRALLAKGVLTAGHARALLPLKAAAQEKAAKAVAEGGLSVRQTEALAKKLLSETDKSPSPKAAKAGVDYTAEAEKELSSRLSRGCRIVTGRKKGKIELEYYGLDDLNDLIDALRVLEIHKHRT